MYNFFSSTLPDTGFFCIGVLKDKGFAHRWFDDKKKAYDFAISADDQGETVYYAQASFIEPTNRKGENSALLRSFFLDVDCGEGKPFATQAEGIKATVSFCNSIGLPLPSIVNSGNGLYCYWRLTEDITSAQWLATARVIKSLCTELAFEVDPTRTADRSSVLRPVGVSNRKNSVEKPVRLAKESPPLAFHDLFTIITEAAKKHHVQVKTFDAPDTQLNAEFQLEMSGEKPSAHSIAEKCHQIGLVRDRKGDVSEPLWYAAIGLLKSTIEAPEIIHEWSQGHQHYTREATDRKIDQHKVHASTCHHFHSINPEGCVGCRHHGKINSPWRLGLAEPKKVEQHLDIPLPQGFSRTDKGIVYDDGENIPIHVYPYDIYPVKLSQDETLAQEIMTLRAKDPHTGWFDVQVRTAYLHDGKQLLMALADQGVHPHYGKNERALFMALLSGYMQSLKDNRRKIILSQQMGWTTEPDGRMAFVLGDRLISDRGVEEVGIARCADSVVKSITTEGDVETWAEATKILDEPGLEPWAFTLAALGFGAPLMKFTGYKGSMLSMVGESGLGKTAMGWWSLSLWGNPEKLQMIQRDSHNATVARMSLYNNLPLFIDEITNIKQEVLSDLAYQITQGRDKHTLNRNRSERSALPWATIGAASSNKSLVDILGGYRSDPSAEINRIFEYEFPKDVTFDGVKAYRTFMYNYGCAGEVYAQYLVQNQQYHSERLLKIQSDIERDANCKPEERFWAVAASCAIYGAAIGSKLGLFNVDVARLREWIIAAICKMRFVKRETVTDASSWLGSFVSKYAANMLVVEEREDGLFYPVVPPRGPLYIRKDVTNKKLWISRDFLRKEANTMSFSYGKLKKELGKALLNESQKMMLGKGTMFAGVAEICWVLDLTDPSLGHVVMRMVKDEEIAEAVKSGTIPF